MKKLSKILLTVFAVSLGLGIYSCSSEDEYLKYTEGGEISYTGKIEDLEIYPGLNRIQLKGVIKGDPKVTELRIEWNNRQQSVEIPIVRSEGEDAISEFISPIPEGSYNFEVRTFDADGNSSVSQFVNVSVYGERYQESLSNRPVITNVLVNGVLTINFADMDRSTGVTGTEIVYTNTSDQLVTVFVPILDEEGNLVSEVSFSDVKDATSYIYRTKFLPENSIDTFYFDYSNPIFPPSVVVPPLVNAKQPFATNGAALVSGRWGTLEGWITNDAAKSHGTAPDNQGGFDNGCCNDYRNKSMNLESGWGQPDFVNAKIYQSVTLQPANYELVIDVLSTNYASTGTASEAYLVVATGVGLPDVVNVSSATEVLGYMRMSGSDSGGTFTVPFTITDPDTEISFGIIATLTGNQYGNIKSWTLNALQE